MVQQKESRHVCKILLTLKLDSSARETGPPSHKKEVLCSTTKRKPQGEKKKQAYSSPKTKEKGNKKVLLSCTKKNNFFLLIYTSYYYKHVEVCDASNNRESLVGPLSASNAPPQIGTGGGTFG